ncbi:MAG: biopolymer transporter ExbD [Sandaracinaceae bacterium]|nr:biopolymer transporter ExbD [Sandaracinaceae bacterium]
MTPRQRLAIRRATRSLDADPSETPGELNVVPLLDVVVNLMLFLLATSAATIAIAEVQTELPPLCPGARCGSVPGEALSVTVTDTGLVLAGRSGRHATVPRAPDGAYDFAALGVALARARTAHPRERAVTLSADPMVPYADLVAAMDAIRGPFEQVRLSAGVR